MRFVVYDGMAEYFERVFDDCIVRLDRGVVVGVSEDIFKILWDCRKKNRINEVTGLDGNAKKMLK
jgi:hypothetical protein